MERHSISQQQSLLVGVIVGIDTALVTFSGDTSSFGNLVHRPRWFRISVEIT